MLFVRVVFKVFMALLFLVVCVLVSFCLLFLKFAFFLLFFGLFFIVGYLLPLNWVAFDLLWVLILSPLEGFLF